ncbi:MAG: hypothetical protein V4577_07430 [Bacteroidota bacterium]
MEKAQNRVLLAFKNWEDRKKEIEPLLEAGTADAQTLSSLQLDHLRQAKHRLRQTARPDEKPFMILLNNQIARLEKQLYPNLLRRVFSQLQDRLFDGPAYLRQQQLQRNNNMESLKLQLKEAGLGSIAGRLENHLDPELRSVAVPLACQLDPENRLTFTLYFEKGAQGDFQLESLHTALRYKGVIGQAHHFQLKDWPGLRANQAWSLLEGRALKQTYTDASGHETQRWVEMGKYGIQHYAPDYAFDIRTALNAMPAITRNKDELIRYLENGQQVPTHWKQGRQHQSIYIQADPANRCIKLLDDKLRPVTAEKLNQNLTRQDLKIKTLNVPVPKMRKGVKHGNQH